MTKSNQAQVAAIIRKELKALGIKARVTSEGYSMGDSVNVYMVDESPETKASVVAFCAKFQYGKFDGMTDCYEYTNTRKDIPQTKYLFVNNECSESLKEAIYQWMKSYWQGGDTLPETYKDGCNVHFQGDWVSSLVHRHFCAGDYLNKSNAA